MEIIAKPNVPDAEGRIFCVLSCGWVLCPTENNDYGVGTVVHRWQHHRHPGWVPESYLALKSAEQVEAFHREACESVTFKPMRLTDEQKQALLEAKEATKSWEPPSDPCKCDLHDGLDCEGKGAHWQINLELDEGRGMLVPYAQALCDECERGRHILYGDHPEPYTETSELHRS